MAQFVLIGTKRIDGKFSNEIDRQQLREQIWALVKTA
jgi:hypothetical protein